MSWPYGVTPVSNEEAHGDQWFARIRAEHERLGTACPCGNGVPQKQEFRYPVNTDESQFIACRTVGHFWDRDPGGGYRCTRCSTWVNFLRSEEV